MSKDESVVRSAYGTTTIAPGVLITIAKMTALSVPGVAGVANVPTSVNRWFRKGSDEGVQIKVDDNAVTVNLYLILASESKVREVCRRVQSEVARAIQEMVGMQVNRIDVHVDDIYFKAQQE